MPGFVIDSTAPAEPPGAALARAYRCKVPVVPNHQVDLRFALLQRREASKNPVSESTGAELEPFAGRPQPVWHAQYGREGRRLAPWALHSRFWETAMSFPSGTHRLYPSFAASVSLLLIVIASSRKPGGAQDLYKGRGVWLLTLMH